MSLKFFALISSSFIISCFMWDCVSTENSAPIKLFLRTGSHKHRKDDVFLIPGKGCKSPLLLIEGGHSLHHRGKTNLLMQGDCDQVKGSEVEKKNEKEHSKPSEVVHLPIPIPVFKNYYHIHPLGYPHTNPIEWQPYTHVEEHQHHYPLPIEHNLGNHLDHHIEPLNEHDDHQYFNSMNVHDHHSKDSFFDKIFGDLFANNFFE